MIIIPSQTISVISSNASTSPDANNPGYMFDDYLNTKTLNADVIEVEIEFNNCDRVALFNLDAYSVDFVLTDDNTSAVVQTKSVDLSTVEGLYKQWIIEGLYIYPNATLKISINKSGGDAACGMCGIGLSTRIGHTQFDFVPGISDYSIKDTNDFGQTYLNEGAWAKHNDLEVRVDIAIVDDVFDDLVDIRGSLVYVDGNEGSGIDFESLKLLGFIEDWHIELYPPNYAKLTMSVQGIV